MTRSVSPSWRIISGGGRRSRSTSPSKGSAAAPAAQKEQTEELPTRPKLERKSSVDHFDRVLKQEIANPQSPVSPEKLKTEAKKSAQSRSNFWQSLVDRAKNPVNAWDRMSPEKQIETSQKALGWKAFAEGKPIPAGVPHDAASAERGQRHLDNILFELRPREQTVFNIQDWRG